MTAVRRNAAALVTGVLVGFGVAVALAIAAPLALGWRSLTVMSGSMEPAVSTGDVVVNRPVAAAAVRPGQVITFRDPSGDGRLMTHRVRRAVVKQGTVEVVTQGDANTGVERWAIPATGKVGLVAYRVPRLGYLLHPVATPAGRLALVGMPLLLWGALSLRAVWREEPEPAHA